MDWRNQGECLEADPELFFPIGTTGPAIQQAEEAKEYCRRCPVISECLRWALDTREDFGVWGGATEHERYGHRRREARARHRDSTAGRA